MFLEERERRGEGGGNSGNVDRTWEGSGWAVSSRGKQREERE